MIKKFIIKHKKIFKPLFILKKSVRDYSVYILNKRKLNKAIKTKNKVIYYLGIPVHANLGDLAQGICIRAWLQKYYKEYTIAEIETNAIVNTYFSVLKRIKKRIKQDDFIVFQSGYTTTDLGGHADEMHRAVMEALPNAKILMMPQTIFFREQSNAQRTSRIYNSMKKMLFLARDKVSYQMALKMFPDIPVKVYPDIVTTLIGTYKFNNDREGVLFCLRDDSEKYYSDIELGELIEKCKNFAPTARTDTTKQNIRQVVKNSKSFLDLEIEKYAHFKVMITDRYHGTILSLVAGTPVIIIKTTDHKVVTGAEWFKGVYDEYVYLAKDLEDAYNLAKSLYNSGIDNNIKPYFEEKYYKPLPKLFQDSIR